MFRWQLLVAVLILAAVGAWLLRPRLQEAADTVAPGTIYDFTVTDINGTTVPLSNFRGKVLLVVNTASECGFTGQYKGLEALYAQYKDQGLVVLGFPCNDFGGQEPGTSEQIKTFCTSKYHVTFPMFAKVSVKGAQRAPLYAWLATSGKAPSWNFGKYLIGRDGRIIGFFPSSVGPDWAVVKQAVEKALGAKG